MAGGLNGRIRRLETFSSGQRCPECGLRPGEPITDYEVIWETDGEKVPEDPQDCSGCRRGLVIVVTWEDLDLEDQ